MMGELNIRRVGTKRYLLLGTLILIICIIWLSLKWTKEFYGQDEINVEHVYLVHHTTMPRLTGVEANAMIDRTFRSKKDFAVTQGWATWNSKQAKTLHIFTALGTKVMNAYAFERADLSGRPGAKGFFLITETSEDQDTGICVMDLRGSDFYSIAGSAC
jgi:hypothetical protein